MTASSRGFSQLPGRGREQTAHRLVQDIPLGQTLSANPGDLGVPDGSWIYLYAFVVWGTDNEAKRAFIYEKGKSTTARYNISGTTLVNDLGLTDVNKPVDWLRKPWTCDVRWEPQMSDPGRPSEA